MNYFAGILRATTAGDLGTLLGNAHLQLHAITVIFQATSQQNALQQLFAGTARNLGISPVSARTRPCATHAIRRVTWREIVLLQGLMLSYATIVLSQATSLLTAPMNGPATTAVNLGT